EKSERVKAAAAGSLHHCLACLGVVPAPEKKEPESPEQRRRPPEVKPEDKPEDKGQRLVPQAASRVQLRAFEQKVESPPLPEVLALARKALDDYQHDRQVATASGGGHRSLADLLNYAMSGPSVVGSSSGAEEKATAVALPPADKVP